MSVYRYSAVGGRRARVSGLRGVELPTSGLLELPHGRTHSAGIIGCAGRPARGGRFERICVTGTRALYSLETPRAAIQRIWSKGFRRPDQTSLDYVGIHASSV